MIFQPSISECSLEHPKPPSYYDRLQNLKSDRVEQEAQPCLRQNASQEN